MSDFTCVVAVDRQHLEELKCVWPTWKRYRPDLMANPWLFLVDNLEIGTDLHFFVGADVDWRFVRVENAKESQRDKMLWGLLTQAPRLVQTPHWVKLDTDTVATAPGRPLTDYLDTESLAAPGWPYTKPNDALERLDAWYGSIIGEPVATAGAHCRPGHSRQQQRVYFPRVIGWLTVIDTAFSRRVAEFLSRTPPPFISHDTLLWYLAMQWGEPAKRLSLKGQGWDHKLGLRSIEEVVKEVMGTTAAVPQVDTPPRTRPPAHSRVLSSVLQAHFGDRETIRNGAEIGVYRGQTAEYLLSIFPRLSLLLVDPWTEQRITQRDKLSGQRQSEHNECRSEAESRVQRFGARRTIVPAFSTSASFLVYPETLDFAFIDALHEYAAVCDDIAAWWPKVRSGGMLCGHDYGHRRFRGVTQAVNEFATACGLEVKAHPRKIWSIRKP